jgi:hypothetical protein
VTIYNPGLAISQDDLDDDEVSEADRDFIRSERRQSERRPWTARIDYYDGRTWRSGYGIDLSADAVCFSGPPMCRGARLQLTFAGFDNVAFDADVLYCEERQGRPVVVARFAELTSGALITLTRLLRPSRR